MNGAALGLAIAGALISIAGEAMQQDQGIELPSSIEGPSGLPGGQWGEHTNVQVPPSPDQQPSQAPPAATYAGRPTPEADSRKPLRPDTAPDAGEVDLGDDLDAEMEEEFDKVTKPPKRPPPPPTVSDAGAKAIEDAIAAAEQEEAEDPAGNLLAQAGGSDAVNDATAQAAKAASQPKAGDQKSPEQEAAEKEAIKKEMAEKEAAEKAAAKKAAEIWFQGWSQQQAKVEEENKNRFLNQQQDLPVPVAEPAKPAPAPDKKDKDPGPLEPGEGYDKEALDKVKKWAENPFVKWVAETFAPNLLASAKEKADKTSQQINAANREIQRQIDEEKANAPKKGEVDRQVHDQLQVVGKTYRNAEGEQKKLESMTESFTNKGHVNTNEYNATKTARNDQLKQCKEAAEAAERKRIAEDQDEYFKNYNDKPAGRYGREYLYIQGAKHSADDLSQKDPLAQAILQKYKK